MSDPVAGNARAAAERLTSEIDPRLPADVERELHQPGTERASEQYIDVVSCASLVVSVATLAWTIYQDIRRQKAKPSSEVMARRIRVETRDAPTPDGVTPAQQDRIITVVVEETLRSASDDTD